MPQSACVTAGALAALALNPFRYRGYVYDYETGFYYLQSRYYDPETGRFISADGEMAGVGGDLLGYNLFAYCQNDPVNMVDPTGNWPKWLKKIGQFLSNYYEAALLSIEAQIGIGVGFGADISNNLTAEISRDTYVGIDDGQVTTGNVITMEVSILDSPVKIGETFDYLAEKGGKRLHYHSPLDGPFDMIFYPDTEYGNQVAIGPVVVNNSGDVLLSLSASAHFFGGEHASIAFNLTEFFGRLFD